MTSGPYRGYYTRPAPPDDSLLTRVGPGTPCGEYLRRYNNRLPCNWLQIVENASDPIHNAFLHAISSGQQFSPAFNVLPALDFPETPLGFLAMAPRKVKDFVFIRASDVILPNVGQFPNGANTVDGESCGVRPWLTRWATPLDDHHSLCIGVAHLNHYNNPTGRMRPEQFGVDLIPFIGQTAERPYAEWQREPGDYDAIVSQGAIANREAEHLGTTDRGVARVRRMLATAIGAVKDGQVPETDGLPPKERDDVAAERIRRLLAVEPVA